MSEEEDREAGDAHGGPASPGVGDPGVAAGDEPERPKWLPGRRLPVLLGLAVLPGLLGGGAWWATVALLAVLLAAARHDAREALRAAPEVERRLPPRWVEGRAERVELHLQAGAQGCRGAVRDGTPLGWPAPEEQRFELAPRERRILRYDVVPPERGAYRFGDVWLRLEGPWDLGAVLVRRPAAVDCDVLPTVVGSRQAARVARAAMLREQGFRRLRRVGGSGEFEQLREYVPGDPYRAIDWKATARRRWPVVRQDAEERSRNVLLVLENGRGMARVASEDGRSRLAQAIDAALLLAFVALRHDDRVGLCVVADQVQHFLPPGRGAAQYRRLLKVVTPLRAREAFADALEVARRVRAAVSGPTLVVWLGDVLEPAQAEDLERAASLLRPRHRLLALTFRDETLQRALTEAVAGRQGAVRRAAAVDVAREREQLAARLRRAGVELVEADGPSLGEHAVERYLEARRRPW